MKPYILVAAAIMIGPAVHAQSAWNPSSDELINLLKPKMGGPTRGIHPIAPESVAREQSRPVMTPHNVVAHMGAPRPQAAAPVNDTARPGDLASVPLKVQFENGSDRLTPAAVKTLDILGRALSSASLVSYRFRIEGHTDAVGSHDVNAVLSARRADAVTDYISSHYDINRSRLTSVGMGDSQMLIATPPGVAEPRNRRVQIVNIGS